MICPTLSLASLGLSASLVSLNPVPPQAIDLSPRFTLGDVHEFQVAAVSMMSDTSGTEITYRLDVGMRLTVLGTEDAKTPSGPDDEPAAVASITAIFSDVVLTLNLPDSPAQTFEYHAQPASAGKSGQDKSDPAKARADGDGGVVSDLGQALAETVLRFDCAGDGTVVLITGLDAVSDAAVKYPIHGQRLLGPFSRAGAPRLLANMFSLGAVTDLGAHTRSLNESWPVTVTIPLAGGRSMIHSTTYSLTGIDGDVASITGETSIAIAPDVPTVKATAPVYEILEQRGTASAQWNAAAGRLISRQSETMLRLKASLGDSLVSESSARTTLDITRR